ncbi:tetratricopeptide repeat protein [Nocardia sp. NPDC056100]|uniref:tetratricopeptide repeat protein n=1 Tax=Nocardia sp. NPDC056100 TaxID=3345712 RepID=UPI0035D960DF
MDILNGSGRSGLAAYCDLRSDAGPIHARVAADLGAKLLAGESFPFYQTATPALLRVWISLESPDIPVLNDPRELSREHRSPEWEFLCGQVDAWPDLPPAQQLRVVKVLAKLAFWEVIVDLIAPGDDADAEFEVQRLRSQRDTALLHLDADDHRARAGIEAFGVRTATDATLPASVRLSAALNLVVSKARSSGGADAAEPWATLAESLLPQVPDEGEGLLLRSVCWRGISYVPHLRGDRETTRRRLDNAEDFAVRALAQASLSAQENMIPILQTRARAAWDCGDLDAAHNYYRRLADHDPLDPSGCLRLAEFLFRTDRAADARTVYLRAAALGTPDRSYALAQAARCAVL